MKFSPSTAYHHCDSPLGQLLLAANGDQLSGVWFDAQRHLPITAHWRHAPTHPVLQAAARQLTEYFACQRKKFELALDFSAGTEFQQSVWRSLLDIPFGATTSYAALSHNMGKPNAVRAVGGAVGRNPLGIIVPCHRVIGANGSLTGYAGGLERKVALLELESRR
jgi:methylated-DNA-[protein]-cysteine S-methyltransferase